MRHNLLAALLASTALVSPCAAQPYSYSTAIRLGPLATADANPVMLSSGGTPGATDSSGATYPNGTPVALVAAVTGSALLGTPIPGLVVSVFAAVDAHDGAKAYNATRETREEDYQGVVKLVENAEANRVQLIFPGKPSAEVRTKLKKSGFRWSPSEGAWQRQLNSSAVYWAKELVKEITKEG